MAGVARLVVTSKHSKATTNFSHSSNNISNHQAGVVFRISFSKLILQWSKVHIAVPLRPPAEVYDKNPGLNKFPFDIATHFSA